MLGLVSQLIAHTLQLTATVERRSPVHNRRDQHTSLTPYKNQTRALIVVMAFRDIRLSTQLSKAVWACALHAQRSLYPLSSSCRAIFMACRHNPLPGLPVYRTQRFEAHHNLDGIGQAGWIRKASMVHTVMASCTPGGAVRPITACTLHRRARAPVYDSDGILVEPVPAPHKLKAAGGRSTRDARDTDDAANSVDPDDEDAQQARPWFSGTLPLIEYAALLMLELT